MADIYDELYGGDVKEEKEEPKPEVDVGDDDEGLESGDEDDDDVQFVIGDDSAPGLGGQPVAGSHHRTLAREGEEAMGAMGAISMQKAAVDEKPSLFELDLDTVEGWPWRNPDARVSDWFNYGFTEETWRLYCRKQVQLREQNKMQGRIEVMAPSSRRSRSRSRSRDRDRSRRSKRSRSRGEVKRERSRSRERKRR